MRVHNNITSLSTFQLWKKREIHIDLLYIHNYVFDSSIMYNFNKNRIM